MKRKITQIFLAMLLVASMITYSYAATSSELSNQKSDLVDQKKETEENLEEVKVQISDALQSIQDLDASIDEKQTEINQLNQEISTLETEIEEKEADIAKKEEEYQETDKLLQERLVAMYEAGETSYLDVLFSSDGLMDFISKYYWLTELAECDTQLMEQIEQERIAIENEKAEVEKNKQQIEENKKSVQTKQTELKVQKAKRETEASALSAEEKELQAEIEQVTKEIQAVENEILRVAAEEAKKNQNNNSAPSYTGGALEWPCPNYKRISSGFGYRGSAATGGVGSSNHKGIDLAASQGSAILAAESGTVITVKNSCSHDYAKNYWNRCSCGGGYGNYVMISHGGGLVTIYAHCSSISVAEGQHVSRGQQIGTVGSTGYSTGFHLHFGVTLNGTYVNPMNYLQ